MKALATLLRVYFVGTPIRRGVFALGVVLFVAGIGALLAIPAWTLGVGMHPEINLFVQALLATLPWFAVIMLFFAGSLMPIVVGRMLSSRQLSVLPHGRPILLASVLVVVGLLALATAGYALLAFAPFTLAIGLPDLFWRVLAASLIQYGIMYLAVWIVGRLKDIWLLTGSLLLVVAIVLPLNLIAATDLPFDWPYYVGFAAWVLFAAFVLGGWRIGAPLLAAWRSVVDRVGAVLGSTNGAAGREMDLMLGIGRPWLIALGQAVPIVAAAVVLGGEPVVWLFFLTLFSAISGAVTSYAARRTRGLWLRGDWSRAELFRIVEAAYLRHNAYSLVVLEVLLIAVGLIQGYSMSFIALGVPLIALGSVTSSYLGLIMTRGLGWGEAVLGAGTMVLLMATALSTADSTAPIAQIALEGLCAALAYLARRIAVRRWAALDWMLCQSEDRAARGMA